MSEDFDKEMLDFLVQSYRSAVAHLDDYATTLDEVEETLYTIVREEDWERLADFVEEKEEELDEKLTEIRSFVEQMEKEDLLETDEDEVIGKMPQPTYQALKRKAKNLEGKEGIAYTDKSVGIEDLWNLQEDIYEEYGQKLFVISAQKEWNGRISVELSDTRQKFEIFTVYEDSNKELYYRHFGQSVPNKGYNVKDSHVEGFFVYKFKKDNTEYLLFSPEKLSPMRCRVTGTHFKINDRTEIGDNRTLPTNQDVIFVKGVEPAITKIPEEEIDEWKKEVDHDDLAMKLHGDFRHPEWFERLTQAMVFVNEDFGWPPHFFWFGPTSTGKSYWLQGLNRAMDCPAGIYSGTGSTVKGLTPSFKDQPPKEGHLLESQRLALVDEFMNLLQNSTKNNNQNQKEVFRPLLELLEHKDRVFSSGNGSIRGQMQGNMMATGNPSYGIKNMMQAVEKLDPAFMGRCILYDQLDSHIEFINDNKKRIKREYDNEEEAFPEFDADFVSLVDTLREDVRVEVDYEEVESIHSDLKSMVPADFVRLYEGRYDHHIQNVVAGIAKANTLIEDRDEFEAREKDYAQAREIFEVIVGSWGSSVNLKEMSVPSRPHYLPDEERRIYEQIRENPGIEKSEIEADVDSLGMKLNNLTKIDVVGKEDGCYYPYWHEGAYGDGEKVKGYVG